MSTNTDRPWNTARFAAEVQQSKEAAKQARGEERDTYLFALLYLLRAFLGRV
jgi:hypothetical protein